MFFGARKWCGPLALWRLAECREQSTFMKITGLPDWGE